MPNHDDSLEPSPAELGDTTTLAAGEWTPLDEIGTQIYVYGTEPVDVAIQYAEVESEARQLRRDVQTYERRYLDVRKVLDVAIGAEPEDGAGGSLVTDVALVAHRYELALKAIESVGGTVTADLIRNAQLPLIRNARPPNPSDQSELDTRPSASGGAS